MLVHRLGRVMALAGPVEPRLDAAAVGEAVRRAVAPNVGRIQPEDAAGDLLEGIEAFVPRLPEQARWRSEQAEKENVADACDRLVFVERKSGRPIRRMIATSEDGRALGPRDICAVAGPGITGTTDSLE